MIEVGKKYEYKNRIYEVDAVMAQSLIQFEDEWTQIVLYTTADCDKSFVRSVVEFERKFYPLEGRIEYDGLYRPGRALDGKRFEIARYIDVEGSHTGDSSAGIRREVVRKGGSPQTFHTYESAKLFADKLNAGFKR